MTPVLLQIHVEEASMVAAMEHLLPRMVGSRAEWKLINHRGKQRLLGALPAMLRGYARMPGDIRILVLVDRDADDCHDLKHQLENAADRAQLATKSRPRTDGHFRVVNRIVIEELEAWFCGDPDAVEAAYSGTKRAFAKAPYRDPDLIAGGTWEALNRILQNAGHFPGVTKIPKRQVASDISANMDPNRNRSPSFQAFRQGLDALLAV